MAFPILIVCLIITLIWLGVLTFFLRKLITQYAIFTHGANKKTLNEALSAIVEDLHETKKDIAILSKRYDTIEKDGANHIQKIGLLRFNPFNDTGGDQSFILAFIDAHETGVVITALYSRSGTRWYAKRVVKGKGLEHELSEEEKKALRIAQNSNVIKHE